MRRPFDPDKEVRDYCDHMDDLVELYFSIARRPRTKEKIAYCNNCRSTFPNTTRLCMGSEIWSEGC